MSLQEAIMTVQFSRKALTAFSAGPPVTRSGLVRRLVRARNDPGKERIRKWLIGIDDAKLQSDLGLALEDIAVLREWYVTKSASTSRSD
jgi:hypothetical protein